MQAIEGGTGRLETGSGPGIMTLLRLGGWNPLLFIGEWSFRTTDQRELGRLLGRLRDAGVAMAHGPSGWPPSAIFEDLREKGYVSGPYTGITWRDPWTWELLPDHDDQSC